MSPPSVQHCASKVVSVTCYVLCSLLLWSISEDTLCVKCLNCWTNFRVLLQRPSNWKHTHSDILNIVQQHWKMKSLAHATPVLVYPKPLFIPLTTWAVFFLSQKHKQLLSHVLNYRECALQSPLVHPRYPEMAPLLLVRVKPRRGRPRPENREHSCAPLPLH